MTCKSKSYNFESSCTKTSSKAPLLWDCIIPRPRNCLPDPVDFTDKICGDFTGGIFISKGLANATSATVYLARVQGDLLFSDVRTDFMSKPHREDPTSKCWIQIPDKDYVDGLHMFTLEKLSEEVQRAKTKENELANSIRTETDRARNAESALRDDLQTEKTKLETKIRQVETKVDSHSATIRLVDATGKIVVGFAHATETK